MSEIKEELYQSMLIGDLTISSGTSKEILEYIEKLENQLQQKENTIKEAINYIKEESWFCYKDNEEVIDRTPVNKLLEILGDNDE